LAPDGLGTSFRPACSNPARDFSFLLPAGSPHSDSGSHLTWAVLYLWISLRSPCVTPWSKRSKASYRSLLYFPDATSQRPRCHSRCQSCSTLHRAQSHHLPKFINPLMTQMADMRVEDWTSRLRTSADPLENHRAKVTDWHLV
jgi:hypothetical protein